MKASEKLQYAVDLQEEGDNGVSYLASQFNKFCLNDLHDYARTTTAHQIIESAKELVA